MRKSYHGTDDYYKHKRDCRHLTLDETAEIVGVTRQQVYQTEQVGLFKLVYGLMCDEQIVSRYEGSALNLLVALGSTTTVPYEVLGKVYKEICFRYPGMRKKWSIEQ